MTSTSGTGSISRAGRPPGTLPHRGIVEATMKHRRERKNVEGVPPGHGPHHLWRVSCRIPESTEQTFEQSCDAGLLGSLPIGGQAVEYHAGTGRERACCVHQRAAVTANTSESTQLVSNTLGRLQHGMKVVLLHELRAAEGEH